MSRSRVIRTESDTYRVLCTHCGTYTEIQHRQLPGEHRKFKVTCACGHVSRVLCERRREARQPVRIKGSLFALCTKDKRGDIAIVELSISGLGFTCELIDLQVGDRCTVGFFLDDESDAWVEQDIEIRTVTDSRLLGAEFVNPDQYSLALDVYLMRVEGSD